MKETKGKAKIHPRKLARQMARAQLEKEHVTGYNKEHVGMNGKKTPSVFARNWRDLSMQAAGMKKTRKKQGR